MRREEIPVGIGAPPRPKAETVVRHARHRVGEVSRTKRSAINSQEQPGEHLIAPTGVSSVRTIVRATCKLQIAFADMEEAERKYFWKLADQNQRALTKAINKLMRRLDLLDGEALLRLPKGTKLTYKNWPISLSMAEAYHYMRQFAPEVATSTIASASRAVYKKWKQVRWGYLVQDKDRPPRYTCHPIPIHTQSMKLDEEGVTFQLAAGTGNRVRVPLKVKDGWQRRVLKNLVEGEWKIGQAQLSRKPDRPGRWFLTFAYKRLIPAVSVDQKTAAVNRGIRNFLVVSTYTGEALQYEGADIAAHLKQTQARRRKIQRSYRLSGRKGRGKKKVLRPLQHLQNASYHWRNTRSQTIARRTAQWLVSRNITTVFLEDFSDIRHNARQRLGPNIGQRIQEWRYYDLEQRLTACCEEAGLHVVKVEATDISQQCPECGHVSEENRDLQRWRLKCAQCGYNENLDVAASRNVRQRGEREGGEVLVGSESWQKQPTEEDEKKAARKAARKRRRGKGTRGPRSKKV